MVKFNAHVHTPGCQLDLDPYRCELAGLYASIIVTNELCKFHSITSGEITWDVTGSLP